MSNTLLFIYPKVNLNLFIGSYSIERRKEEKKLELDFGDISRRRWEYVCEINITKNPNPLNQTHTHTSFIHPGLQPHRTKPPTTYTIPRHCSTTKTEERSIVWFWLSWFRLVKGLNPRNEKYKYYISDFLSFFLYLLVLLVYTSMIGVWWIVIILIGNMTEYNKFIFSGWIELIEKEFNLISFCFISESFRFQFCFYYVIDRSIIMATTKRRR